jgi:hypothetical protein
LSALRRTLEQPATQHVERRAQVREALRRAEPVEPSLGLGERAPRVLVMLEVQLRLPPRRASAANVSTGISSTPGP